MLLPCSHFFSYHVRQVMRVIEIMGIEQGRTWGTCSLNDFRRVRRRHTCLVSFTSLSFSALRGQFLQLKRVYEEPDVR